MSKVNEEERKPTLNRDSILNNATSSTQEFPLVKKLSTDSAHIHLTESPATAALRKRFDETSPSTPRANRNQFNFPSSKFNGGYGINDRKRPQSFNRGNSLPRRISNLQIDSSSLFEPQHVTRRGSSLTPTRRKKNTNLNSSSTAPVPRAWSSLVLENPVISDPITVPFPIKEYSSRSLRSDVTDDDVYSFLDDIKKQNEQLKKENELLLKENLKFRSFFPQSRDIPEPVSNVSYSSSNNGSNKRNAFSPTKKKEYEGFGIGDPASELIMRAEARADDDLDVARTKIALRELMSVTNLLKTLNHTVREDRKTLLQAQHEAKEAKVSLVKAQQRILELEEELSRRS